MLNFLTFKGFLLVTLFLTFSPVYLKSESCYQTKTKSIISGRVTDAATGEPIVNVNLFLANTTFGSSTGKDGRYLIRNVPPGTYDLIVSHISYEFHTVRVKLLAPDSISFNFSLRQRALAGEKVSVTATVPKNWKKDLKKFIKLFIGKSVNSKNCKILNPEVINFKTTENRIFTAFTDSTILVENLSLGYMVSILLKSFEYSGKTKDLKFVIYPKFETIPAQSEIELDKWLKNRNDTYTGSLRHFIKSLAKNRVKEEGFSLSYASRPGKLGLIPIDLTTEKFLEPYDFGVNRFCFDEIINVYHKDKGNSWIKVENPSTLVDFSGNFIPNDGIKTWGAWAQDRIADLLPLDYQPESANPVSSVPFYAAGTPAVDSLEKAVRSKRYDVISGNLIVAALDELVFKNSGHGEVIKQLHKDILDIMNDADLQAWKSLQTNRSRAEFLRRFWLLRDLSFGTKKNERLEEHYKRLQYARTVYSALTPTGYDDRGRIYVKYGKPETKQTDVMPLYKSIDNQKAEIKMAPGKSLETWVYQISGKNIVFNFVDKGWGYSIVYTVDDIVPAIVKEGSEIILGEILRSRADLDVRFAAAYSKYLSGKLSETGGNEEIFRELRRELRGILREQIIEQKQIPIAIGRQFENISELNFAFKPALFEDSHNEPILETAYGFRENDIKFGKSVDGTEQAINIRTVARDRDLRDLSLTEHSVSVKPAGFDESGELISLKQIPIRTNYFYLIATVDNPAGKQKGFKDYTIKFPVYKESRLHLSSVIFAKDISPVEQQRKSSVVSPFVRHNLVIRMDPFTELRASQPVYLYFEIYDLQKNKDGKTEYGIEYTVTPVKKTGVLHFIAGLNPFKKSGGKISISYDQEGRENNDYFSVRLDLSQLVPGPYIMNVRVKDKTANVAKETKTDFVLQ